jgi:hypothetical protein
MLEGITKTIVSRPRNNLPVAVPCGQGNFRLRRKLIPWCGRSALLPAPLLAYVFPNTHAPVLAGA